MKSNTNDQATFFSASWDAWRVVREGKQGIANRQQERLRALVAYARRHSRYIAAQLQTKSGKFQQVWSESESARAGSGILTGVAEVERAST